MVLPYLLCIKLFIENGESLYAFTNNLWINVNNTLIQNTPISWNISNYISYNWLAILCLYIISYAFEFCWKHQIAIYYLGVNLIEKQLIDNLGINENGIPYYLIINNIIIVFILILGINQFIKNKKHG